MSHPYHCPVSFKRCGHPHFYAYSFRFRRHPHRPQNRHHPKHRLCPHTAQRPIPNEKTLTDCIGPPLTDSFAKLLPQPSSKRIEAAIAHYRTRFSTQGLFENQPYEGIHTALSHLTQTGNSLHLATSKPHIFAQQILEHFELVSYFTSIHCSELDGTRSAKTALIAHVLKTEAIAPKSATMVGDRSHDIIGAIANNITAVGVLWGYGSKTELIQAGAQKILTKTSELSNLNSL